MARSAEKAMAILSRWTAMMNAEDKPVVATRRPFLATECNSLKEAEKWRHQIIREISKKVSVKSLMKEIKGLSLCHMKGLASCHIKGLNDSLYRL